MATRGKSVKLRADRFDLDDDLNIPSFDFPFDDVDDNRKPTAKVKDGIKAGLKSSLSRPSLYGNLLRGALPSEYGQAFDTYERVGSNLRQVYKEARDELRPGLGDIARSAESFIPDSMKGAKDALLKIQKWSDSAKQMQHSAARQREDNMALELGNIFKTQFEQQVKDTARADATKKVDDALGVIRHRDQMAALSQMSFDIQRLAQYQTGITQAFQRKSLELQYRSYFVQADSLELQKKSIAALTNRLDAISKNTALPDFVKTRSSEYMREQVRNKFLQGAVGNLFGGAGQSAEEFFKNITGGLKEQASRLASILGMASMGLDTAGAMRGMGGDPLEGGAKNVTDFLLSASAARTGARINQSISRRSPRLSRLIQTGANNLRYLRSTGSSALADFSDAGYDFERGDIYNSIVSPLRSLVSMGLGQRGVDTGFQTDNLASMRAASTFNNQTQKSVTEIIPGLLSRILREIVILRTGDEGTPLVTYDYQANKFTTLDTLAEGIKSSILRKENTDYFANSFKNFLGGVGLDNLDEKEQQEFAKYLLGRVMGGGSFNVKTFTDADQMSGMDLNTIDKISKHFTSYYDAGNVKEDERALERSRRRANVAGLASSFGTMLGDPRSLVQQLINAGQLDTLRQAGLVSERGGSISLNVDNLLNQAVSGLATGSESLFTSPTTSASAAASAARSFRQRRSGGQLSSDVLTSIAQSSEAIHQLTLEQNSILTQMLDSQKAVASLGATGGGSNKLQTVEDLLAIIAANTAGGGYGGQATGDTPIDSAASNSSFTSRWPNLFKGARDRLKSLREGEGDNVTMMQAMGDLFSHVAQFTGVAASRGAQLGRTAIERGAVLGQRGLTFATSLGKNIFDKTVRPFTNKSIFDPDNVADRFSKILDKPLDLFVGNDLKPRLYKIKMQAGKYLDVTTNKIITKVSDITGDVIDIDTGDIVLAKDDIAKLVYYPGIVAKAKGIGEQLLRFGANLASTASSLAAQYLPAGWRMVGQVASFGAQRIATLIDKPKDIYVKGEKKPRLFKYGFENGLYFLKKSGTKISKPSEIKDEVVDADGNTLLSADDLETGIVDVNGQPISSLTRQAVAAIAATAIGAARKGFDVASTLLRSTKDLIGNIAKGSWQNIKDFFANFGFGFFGKESLDVLKQIRDILDDRLPGGSKVLGDSDNSGQRDASWQELRDSDEYNSGARVREFDDKAEAQSKKTGNIFDKAQAAVTDMISGLIDGALDMLGLGLGLGAGGGKDGKPSGEGSTGGRKGTKAGGGRVRGMLGKIGNFGMAAGGSLLSALGLGGLFSSAGNKISSGVRGAGAAAGNAFGGIRSALAPAAAGLAAAGGPFGAIMRSGMSTTAAAGRLGGRALQAGANMLPGALSLGGRAVGGAARGAGAALSGIGALGRLGMKAIPIAGGLYGVTSGVSNAMAGNYGAAALDAGIATTSLLGVGGTLSALGTGLGALAGAVFSPIGLTALAVGGALYGSYKLYKWITRKTFNDLSNYRMLQYGIGDKDEEFRMQIYNLEKMLEPAVIINGSQASLDEGKIDLEDMLKIFKINKDDNEGVSRFGKWFQNRFKPVYFTWMAALNSLYGKARIDNVENESRSAEDKLKLLNLVKMDNGPWAELTLPFVTAPRSVVSEWIINQMASALNKRFASEVNKSLGKDGVEANALLNVGESGSKAVAMSARMQSQTQDDSAATHQIAKAFRNELAAGSAITVNVEGDKTGQWLFDKNITAFEAVVLKSYGLKTFKRSLVASLRWLEYHCTQYLKPNANDTIEFSADPVSVQKEARKYFGISEQDEKANASWLKWFLTRFLPAYTSKVTGQRKEMGNDNFGSYRLLFNNLSQGALEIVKLLMGKSDIWSVTDSPWPQEELNTNSATCQMHVNFIIQNVKDTELVAQAAQNEQDRINRKLNSDAQAKAQQERNARAAAQAQSRTTQSPSGAQMSKVVYTSQNDTTPSGNNIYNSSPAKQFIRYTSSGMSVKGMHPEFLKLFLAAVADYNKATGNSVLVNESIDEQGTGPTTYNLRELTQNNGAGMIQSGLAVNIDPNVANEMERLGILSRYGLARPIEGAAYHIEPAGIQMLINRANNNKDIIGRAIQKGAAGVGTVGESPAIAALNTSQLPSTRRILREGDPDALGRRISGNVRQAEAGMARAQRSVATTTRSTPTQGSYASKINQSYIADPMDPRSSGTPSIGGSTVSGPLGQLLTQIADGEGTTDNKARRNNFGSAYDVVLGYGAYGRPDKPLSTMTVGEVKEFQLQMLRNPKNKWNSSAAGKYQIVRTTLMNLQRQMGFSDNQIFDAAFQDRLAIQLLKGRGLDSYLSGNMDQDKFQVALSKEWASIANPNTGRSFYGQATGTPNNKIQPILASLRTGKSSNQDISDVSVTQMAQASGATGSDSGEQVAAAPATMPARDVETATALSTARGGIMTVSDTTNRSAARSRASSDSAALSDAYAVVPRGAPIPRAQPEITNMDTQINKSVENISSILAQSLEVQKSMLVALQGLPEAQAKISNGFMKTVVEQNAANQPDAMRNISNRSSTPIKPAPISVKRKIMT